MTLIAIEEHWILPDLASALRRLPKNRRDESFLFTGRRETGVDFCGS